MRKVIHTNNFADSSPRDSNVHQKWMKHAIELSRSKMQNGAGGPFGAVICRGDKLIAEGWNSVTSLKDPTAHAEVMAIRQACQQLDTFSLAGCTIYTSCEPCPMCLGAIYWARLDAVYFANNRQDAASIGFDDEFLYREISQPLADRLIGDRKYKRGLPSIEHLLFPPNQPNMASF